MFLCNGVVKDWVLSMNYIIFFFFSFSFWGLSPCADSVDVNVTPDKRQVMLHQEKTLLQLVKVSPDAH